MNNCRRAEEVRSVGLCRPVGDAAAIIIIIIIMSMQRQPLSMMRLMMMTKEDAINNS